jgi:hypothetical protein
MKAVLINCEESGVVRQEFERLGWDAWSCDLLPSRMPGNHLQMDARKAITARKWDLIINHPPCTFTALCGNRWYWNSPLRAEGIELCKEIWDLSCQYCNRVALEQPKTIMQRYIGNRSQAIQPYQFGHGETKETWLWLKNLPELVSTNVVEGREHRIWKMAPGPDRQRERSVTYLGIARAMAEQWSQVCR